MNPSSNEFGTCKLCGTRPATCKAHIYPKKYIQRLIPAAEKAALLIGNHKAKHPERTQSGLWERGILCPECDNRLDTDFEKHGYRVLTSDWANNPPIEVENQHPIGVRLETIDVERFRGFIVSLLWRAHHAIHEYYQHVELGPLAEVAKRVIEDKASQEERRIFGIVPFVVPAKHRNLMLCPYRTRYSGLSVYRLYLPPWGIFVKADKRPFPALLREVELMADRPAVAFIQNRPSLREQMILGAIKAANASQSEKVD